MLARFEPMPAISVLPGLVRVGVLQDEGVNYVVVRYILDGNWYEQRMTTERARDFAAQLLGCARGLEYAQ